MPHAAHRAGYKPSKHKTVDNRLSSNQRGYNGRWRKARKLYLARHPLCAECMKNDLVKAADCIDHIIPHKGDMVKFWDKSNWQSLCVTCHNRKTATEDGGFGRERREI